MASVPLNGSTRFADVRFMRTSRLRLFRPSPRGWRSSDLLAAGGVGLAVGFAVTVAGRDPSVRDGLLVVAAAAVSAGLALWRRRDRPQLLSSEHRYRMLVEELPVGLYLDLPNAAATNVYSNPEIVRMLGYPAERWARDPGFFESILHPDDRDRVLAHVREGIESGRFDDVYRLRHADGSYRWIADRGRLVHDEHGKPLYVQGVFLDVTARKEAEMHAEDAQRQYESLVTRLPLVTYIEDATALGKTVYISPQVVDLLGYPVNRWLNEKDFFFRVVDPAFAGAVRTDRTAGNVETVREVRLIAADGTERWVDSRRTLVTDDDGTPLYVLGFWVDTTSRRQLEQQLRRHERLDAVGELAAGLAHNFNNMLLAINGYAEFAAARDTLNEVHRDLEVIRETGDRAARLVHDLLSFSRRQSLAPEPADLREVIEKVLGLLRQLLGPQIEIRFETPDAPAIASIDATQFEQVLVNLAINARDAMPYGGELAIELREQEDADGRVILVAVSDTGAGIPEQIVEHVFDPFLTTKETGSGLGLSSAYGTIRQCGGNIRVAHTGAGEGTTFEITLPVAEAA